MRGCEGNGSMGCLVVRSLGLGPGSRAPAPRVGRAIRYTVCMCTTAGGGGLYGGPGSGGARWHGLWKLWQLSSTSVKTAGMLSGKSYGGGGGGRLPQ